MKKILILLQKIIEKINSKLINYLFNKYDYYVYSDVDPYLNFEILEEKENKELIYSDFCECVFKRSDFE